MPGRRANNEGSIYKRRDGRWAASVTLDGGRRKTFYARTREEVGRRLAKALHEREQGQPLVPEKESVSSYLARWLEDGARATIRGSTFENYERMIRRHIVPQIGHLRLARLAPHDLSRLYRRMLDRGLSPRTAQLAHAILHRALRQAVRWRLVAVNVCDMVDAPRPQRREFRTLNTEEAIRLLTVAEADPFHALYVLALTCGMRQAELLGLRWADLDLPGAVLAVRQQAIRINGGWEFTPPKTDKGRRTIALPVLAVRALRQHKMRQAQERLALGPAWEDNDLVFPNQVGRPIERQNLIRRSFHPVLNKAGLGRLRFHDLRHSAATLMLAQGIHPRVVQERLGHSTISVTMDVYSHVMPTLQKEAARAMDKAFGR